MTRLIAISNETNMPDYDSVIVNALFDEGLMLFHLRKPNWDFSLQRKFLEHIRPEYLNRISVHQNHDTIEEFGLKYYHVKEKNRTNNITVLKKSDTQYSTSFHDIEQLQLESNNWHYCFLGPVYNSISKQNYLSAFSCDFTLPMTNLPVFALGGISTENCLETLDKGFYGLAVLGAIFNEKGKETSNFIRFKKVCRQNANMC
jgi:thiamine-phosphate pyrophosphorylase